MSDVGDVAAAGPDYVFTHQPGGAGVDDEGNLEDRRYEAVWNALRLLDDGDRNHRHTVARAILDALDGVS